MYGKNFDMIYNSKMWANKEFLYAHIFENMMLNNRGEEFGTTLIFTKDRSSMWDVFEGLKKVKGIKIKDNRNGYNDSSIEYQYDIPRTDKVSANRIIMQHYNDKPQIASDNSRGLKCRTLILDTDKEMMKNMDEDLWNKIICPMHTHVIDENYTDAKIFIY